METQLSLFEPLIEQLARRTAAIAAKIVLDELQRNPVKSRWTDTKGAAKHLGWTATALAQRKSAGQIPDDCYTKVGGSVRWDLDALDQWLESLKEAA